MNHLAQRASVGFNFQFDALDGFIQIHFSALVHVPHLFGQVYVEPFNAVIVFVQAGKLVLQSADFHFHFFQLFAQSDIFGFKPGKAVLQGCQRRLIIAAFVIQPLHSFFKLFQTCQFVHFSPVCMKFFHSIIPISISSVTEREGDA